MTNLELAIKILQDNNPYNWGLLLKSAYDNILNFIDKNQFNKGNLNQKLTDIKVLQSLLMIKIKKINENTLNLLLLKEFEVEVDSDLMEDFNVEKQSKEIETKVSLLFITNYWLYQFYKEVSMTYNFSEN